MTPQCPWAKDPNVYTLVPLSPGPSKASSKVHLQAFPHGCWWPQPWLLAWDPSSSYLDLPVGQLTAWELASLQARESQCPCSLISEMTPHCFHLLYLLEARCKVQPTLRSGDATKGIRCVPQRGCFQPPTQGAALPDTELEDAGDLGRGCSLFRDHLWALRCALLETGRQWGVRRAVSRCPDPSSSSLRNAFQPSSSCVAGTELGSVGYLNEHFKRSLHHLFSLLITNLHSFAVASLKVKFWRSTLNACRACPLGSVLIFSVVIFSFEANTQKTRFLYIQYSDVWIPVLIFFSLSLKLSDCKQEFSLRRILHFKFPKCLW